MAPAIVGELLFWGVLYLGIWRGLSLRSQHRLVQFYFVFCVFGLMLILRTFGGPLGEAIGFIMKNIFQIVLLLPELCWYILTGRQ